MKEKNHAQDEKEKEKIEPRRERKGEYTNMKVTQYLKFINAQDEQKGKAKSIKSININKKAC